MVRTLLLVVGITLILQKTGQAFLPPSAHKKIINPLVKIEQKTIKQLFLDSASNIQRESLGNLNKVKRDLVNNQIRLLSGNFGSIQTNNPTQKNYIELALAFVKENYDIFKVKTKDLHFVPDAAYLGKDVQFIKFSVSRNGIAIVDAEINFRFKKQRLIQILNYSYGEVKETKERDIPYKEIKRKAIELTNAKRISDSGEFYRVIEKDKEYTLMKVASFNIATTKHQDLTLQMFKATAKPYELKNNHYNIEGQVKADLYPRWYQDNISETNLGFVSLLLNDNTQITSNNLGYFTATMDSNPKIANGLKGKYIRKGASVQSHKLTNESSVSSVNSEMESGMVPVS